MPWSASLDPMRELEPLEKWISKRDSHFLLQISPSLSFIERTNSRAYTKKRDDVYLIIFRGRRAFSSRYQWSVISTDREKSAIIKEDLNLLVSLHLYMNSIVDCYSSGCEEGNGKA